MSALVVTVHDVSTPALIDDVMAVMTTAFDPAYGEAWTADQTRSMLDLPGARLLVGRVGDETAGFGLIRAIAGEAELLLLGVSPTYRLKGHGRVLLDHCLNAAARDGAKIMFLEVREDNKAVALYKAAHFEHYSSRRDYYLGGDGQRRSALSFRREIAAFLL